MKWRILLAACLTLWLCAPSVYAAESDWQNIFTSSFPLEETSEGVKLSYSNDYAMGYAHKAKAGVDGFTAEVKIVERPVYDGNGRSIWYAVGLQAESILKDDDNVRKGWIFENVGMFVLLVPKDENTTEVAVRYHLPETRGLVEPKGVKLPIKPDDKYTVVIKKDAITVNGHSVDIDQKAMNTVFQYVNGEALPTFGLFTHPTQSDPSTLLIQKISAGKIPDSYPEPTVMPSAVPSEQPSASPSAKPSAEATATPAAEASAEPTKAAAGEASEKPAESAAAAEASSEPEASATSEAEPSASPEPSNAEDGGKAAGGENGNAGQAEEVIGRVDESPEAGSNTNIVWWIAGAAAVAGAAAWSFLYWNKRKSSK